MSGSTPVLWQHRGQHLLNPGVGSTIFRNWPRKRVAWERPHRPISKNRRPDPVRRMLRSQRLRRGLHQAAMARVLSAAPCAQFWRGAASYSFRSAVSMRRAVTGYRNGDSVAAGPAWQRDGAPDMAVERMAAAHAPPDRPGKATAHRTESVLGRGRAFKNSELAGVRVFAHPASPRPQILNSERATLGARRVSDALRGLRLAANEGFETTSFGSERRASGSCVNVFGAGRAAIRTTHTDGRWGLPAVGDAVYAARNGNGFRTRRPTL
jgi:hypothetical protein